MARRAAGMLGRRGGRRVGAPCRGFGRPQPILGEQRVGEHQQLVHDGHKRHLAGLAAGDQVGVLAAEVGLWRMAERLAM